MCYWGTAVYGTLFFLTTTTNFVSFLTYIVHPEVIPIYNECTCTTHQRHINQFEESLILLNLSFQVDVRIKVMLHETICNDDF